MPYAFNMVYNMEKFWIVTALLGAIILTTVLAVYLYCGRLPQERKNMLLILQAVILTVQTGQFLAVVATPVEIDFFIKMQCTGLCLLGLPFFFYCYAVARKRYLVVWQSLVLCLAPAAGLIMVLTNGYHQLFYTVYDTFYFKYGHAYAYIALYNYLLALTSLVLMYVSQRKKGVLNHRQISFGVMAVLSVALIDVCESFAFPFSVYDVTPISISVAQVIFLFGNWRSVGYKTVLKTRMNALDCINQSIVITDSANTVLYINKAPLNTLLKLQEDQDLTGIMAQVLGRSPEVQDTWLLQEIGREYNRETSSGDFALVSPELPVKRYYSYYIQPIGKDSKHIGGLLYSFRDISEYKLLIEQLDRKHNELAAVTEQLQKYTGVVKRLSEETERQKIVQYVNNTVGHSITQIITNLEALDCLEEEEIILMKERIRKYVDCARTGIKKIRASVGTLSVSIVREGGDVDDPCTDSR